MCTGLAYGTDLRSGAFASELNDDGSFSFYLDDFVDVYDHFFGNADVINSSYGSTGLHCKFRGNIYFGQRGFS